MSKFEFRLYKTNAYKVDPIFNCREFKLYGSPAVYNAPELFEVGQFRYVLMKPEDFKKKNKESCFKIAAYLYHHSTEDLNGVPYTYFFGDINECKDIGKDFRNQICKYISYEMVEEWYPKNLAQINDYVVNFFLSQQRYYGQEFLLHNYDMHCLLFLPPSLSEFEFIQSKKFLWAHMTDSGFVKMGRSGDNSSSLILTDKAIDMFQRTKNKPDSNTAFIAIKFNYNEERIQAIQNTIAECGYEPVIMNEYQTNDWIMPEIFHQIQIAKFVVADFSLKCDGVYYEAGYAYAMGKQVIHIYDRREEKINPLHFDVSQKSTVMYDDYEDLNKKLKNRIIATID